MVKKTLILLSFLCFYTTLFFGQVDVNKVEKINTILCDCLEYNKSKNDSIRLEECTTVLYDGLSVIEEKKTRELYAQKSDTYLQRRCIEYVKIIYKNVPASDIELVDKDVFHSAEKVIKSNITGEYYYKDYLGEVFNVEIFESSWSEKIVSTDRYINFRFDKSSSVLTFVKSNDIFFKDFYGIDKEIKIRYKIYDKNNLLVILNLGSGIYLKKTLRKRER
ncbi:hypothetical protein [uncultured Algibacter sp.]|uniref:hypothetical protein n=1 Tax=uncultured Algibacter sp. TaxID=298659 RepID=UPI002604449C|nr:hypothetical protein [uncultured Algibacter sp.]